MDCYKQIAEIRNEQDKQRVLHSLKEIYGPIPEEVISLVHISELKNRAKKLRSLKVTVRKGRAEIVFADLGSLDNEQLYGGIKAMGRAAVLSFKEKPVLTLSYEGETAETVLSETVKFLSFA